MQVVLSVGRCMPIFAVYSLIGGLLSPALSQSLDQMYRKRLVDTANYEKHLYDLVGKSKFSSDCGAVSTFPNSNFQCADEPDKCKVKHPIRLFVNIAPDGKIHQIQVNRWGDPSTLDKPTKKTYWGKLNQTTLMPEAVGVPRYNSRGYRNIYYNAKVMFKIYRSSGFDLLYSYRYYDDGKLYRNIAACRISN